MAEVTVAKQTTSITKTNITDTRLDSSLCGVVQGLIQQVDTGKLFDQQNALFNKMLEEKQKEFDEWFNGIKEMANIH